MQKYIRPRTPPPYKTWGIPADKHEIARRACIGYDCSICHRKLQYNEKIITCLTAYYCYHLQCFMAEKKQMCRCCKMKKKS